MSKSTYLGLSSIVSIFFSFCMSYSNNPEQLYYGCTLTLLFFIGFNVFHEDKQRIILERQNQILKKLERIEKKENNT